jgi:hypothetical protein
LPRRGRRPGFAELSPRNEPPRGRRADRRNPMVSVSVAGHGGRHMRSSSAKRGSACYFAAILSTPGRAFAWVLPCSGQPRRTFGLAAPARLRCAQGARKGGSATNKSSASSWRGLVVDPGGAPAPPEWLVKRTSPVGAPPHPANSRASSGRGDLRLREAWEPGISSGACRTRPDKPRLLAAIRGYQEAQ